MQNDSKHSEWLHRGKRVAHPSLAEFIRRMPKAELHIHLEGSISPRTLLELATKNGTDLAASDLVGVEQLFRYDNFLGFLDVYRACARCLLKGEDFERVAYEMARDLADQNVRYAEVMLSPAQHMQRNMDFDEILGGVAGGFARANREFGIVCRPAFDFGRQFSLEQALRAVELAQAGMDYGVVAFSIGGDEANYPPEPFVEVFAVAKAVGLHVMAHAGEVAGANSVRGAIEMLGVDRIGHGFRVLEDPELTAILARRGDITFDVCPTSNIKTGVIATIDQHPLRRMLDAGLPITLNSDDPTLFDTTVTGEFILAADHFAFTTDEICAVALQGIRGAFMPAAERQFLLAQFKAEQTALRQELGI